MFFTSKIISRDGTWQWQMGFYGFPLLNETCTRFLQVAGAKENSLVWYIKTEITLKN